MGCGSSKLDDSPAVALCRERCAFLDEAVRQRFVFAEAHVAYLSSLQAVGISLDRFFNQDLNASADGPPSPVLNLPAQRKGEAPTLPTEKIQQHRHSRSNSGSHLQFHSDDSEDDDASGSESLHHHDISSPDNRHQLPYGGYMQDYENPNMNFPGGGGGGGGFMNLNYMKKQPTPSIVYTQRPGSSETMLVGESSAYYAYPNYATNSNQNPNPPYPVYNFNSFNNGYPNYPGYASQGGFLGGSTFPPAPYGGDFPSNPSMPSTSKAPPPPPSPPSPPSSSPWDFLNPFQTFENSYPSYTPSRDSREVREEEGIPDLEEEEEEVVKEVHGDQKLVDSGRSSYSRTGPPDEDVRGMKEVDYRARPNGGMDDPVEYEVHVVDKKVVDAEESTKDLAGVARFKPLGGFKGDSEVMREIHVQFERASDSGSEVAKFLEVGTLPYKRKHGVHHVSSKLLHSSMMSSQPTMSKSSVEADSTVLEINHEVELRAENLSSVLHKLYLWEKKLFEEVKVEEKMRVLHDRKSKKLKHLDERGAEAHKIDATRTLVRSLSTKIHIAIQVVDKISVKINSLRDDELWPLLNEFLLGLTRMWNSMLECHHYQCQAIREAKRLDAIALRKHFNDDHFEATRQLEHDLVDWTLRFSHWVGAQKGYIRALNNWLMKCLLYVPEETPDGVVPFSPGRIGAPLVFVACNQWCQSLERVSEKEVLDSMRDFTSNVLHLWDRDKAEMRQKMLANRDERRIKNLDKEDQKIRKEIQALDKRLMLISADDNGMPLTGNVVYQSETTKGGSLQASLQHVLEAMEKFATHSLKIYEELQQRIEEEHRARVPGEV